MIHCNINNNFCKNNIHRKYCVKTMAPFSGKENGQPLCRPVGAGRKARHGRLVKTFNRRKLPSGKLKNQILAAIGEGTSETNFEDLRKMKKGELGRRLRLQGHGLARKAQVTQLDCEAESVMRATLASDDCKIILTQRIVQPEVVIRARQGD